MATSDQFAQSRQTPSNRMHPQQQALQQQQQALQQQQLALQQQQLAPTPGLGAASNEDAKKKQQMQEYADDLMKQIVQKQSEKRNYS